MTLCKENNCNGLSKENNSLPSIQAHPGSFRLVWTPPGSSGLLRAPPAELVRADQGPGWPPGWSLSKHFHLGLSNPTVVEKTTD